MNKQEAREGLVYTLLTHAREVARPEMERTTATLTDFWAKFQRSMKQVVDQIIIVWPMIRDAYICSALSEYTDYGERVEYLKVLALPSPQE